MLKKYILAALIIGNSCNAISEELYTCLTTTSGIFGLYFGAFMTNNNLIDSPAKTLVVLGCGVGTAWLASLQLHQRLPESRLKKAAAINRLSSGDITDDTIDDTKTNCLKAWKLLEKATNDTSWVEKAKKDMSPDSTYNKICDEQEKTRQLLGKIAKIEYNKRLREKK